MEVGDFIIRFVQKYSIGFVLLMLCISVISGCDRVEVLPTEVLEQINNEDVGIRETVPTEVTTWVEDSVGEANTKENRPFLNHGRLTLDGTQIVDELGLPVQLKGVSTHGIQWFPEYVSLDAFRTMRDDWHINVVRLAMYTDPNAGYDEKLHALVEEGVSYAIALDLYVIIDWHILSDGNPNLSKERAIQFFDAMSLKYKDVPNVLYEICNEPNGDVTWARDIKPYAESLIHAIRQNDEKALIIVGTPTWSQDVDIVAIDPIGHQDNILYALHFYAATHKDYLREKFSRALALGLPMIVSEFGISDASGSGQINYEQGEVWLDLLESHSIGYVAWNLSNKEETSALIKSNVSKTSDWEDADLSPWGLWFVNRSRSK